MDEDELTETELEQRVRAYTCKQYLKRKGYICMDKTEWNWYVQRKLTFFAAIVIFALAIGIIIGQAM
jgi:hypothetical protein